jgi:hypothetical protein
MKFMTTQNNTLDCLTPLGVKAVSHEGLIMQKVADHLSLNYLKTRAGTASIVDAALYGSNQELVAIAECKSRDMSYDTLLGTWGGEYLITFEKLYQAKKLAQLLIVDVYLAVYMLQDRQIFLWKIANQEGEFILPLRLDQTVTQRTVNGGSIRRTNAFIHAKYATLL